MDAAPPRDLLSAAGVSKRYGGIAALTGADFFAAAGEVHALLGENGAGKSTFIQILAGAVRADSGTVLLDGRSYAPRSPEAARAAGVAAVFQELSLVPDLTVAENVWFRREPLSAAGTVRGRELRRRTEDLLARHGFPPLSPATEVRRLNLAERQMVEIAKALARDPRVLILDEATSALGPRETEWLLGLARRLAAEGRLVVFISHRLAEVRAVASRVTVFRNGATVARHDTVAVDDDEIIAEMLGRRLDRLYPERRATATDRPALRVRGLAAGHRLAGVDLDLRAGEVMGVAGLQGHGQRELFLSLYGIARARGTVEVWGRPTPSRALGAAAGIALVPEDRRHQGLLLSKSVRENLTLPVIGRFTRWGLLDRGRERAAVDETVRSLRIKAASPEQPAGTLSGGNQQKVVFGKMLMTKARILLLFDPTRGVDVGTKGEIFQLMRDLAAEGYAILFHSTDLQELVRVADRVAVMRDGRVAAMLDADALSEHAILRASMAGAAPGAPAAMPGVQAAAPAIHGAATP